MIQSLIKRLNEYVHYYVGRINALLLSLRGIKVGNNTIVECGAYASTQYGGEISIGDNCCLCRGCQLITHGGGITIGDNSTVNPYTVIYGQGGTTIGNNVRIAAHCVIVPSNHIFEDVSIPIYLQGLSKCGIVIEDDVWLGAGVKVLDGVTIGKGCVVGANAVVTKSLEPYGVYVGIPARLLKKRL